ncbi:Uncharacterised protein [Mycobacteroides abscessus subsp. abscessus]|uniref:hypothetical protein n=1 Tax=Mycobacteroides abscessus TaxID=36809 RepID=UPI0009A8BA9B|nr:hypothetical protein [Mycobacteroides abscessus]SKR19053.1 Uncharacterised protein [Mycobacteroides abscessus subsp. abscessus]
MDDLIGRIDGLLDDDEFHDDWQYPWVDSMRWAPEHVELPSGVWDDQPDEPLDGGWDYHPDTQIHVIPTHQVSEWVRCLEAMPVAEREDVAWYVVCFTCMRAGEREVSCDCGNPSSERDSR